MNPFALTIHDLKGLGEEEKERPAFFEEKQALS
jgi:hypothetical protein